MVTSDTCIGCQACVDICPKHAITFKYNSWGEGKAHVNLEKCIHCSLCEKVCPARKQCFNNEPQNVFAVISKRNSFKGSSGAFFYEVATKFIEEGGVVYGAVFDSKLKLIHKKVNCIKDLQPLCKSKYLHSDMEGVFKDIGVELRSGHKVLFVGTPCQTSAIKNLYKKRYGDQLLLVDFLCHGTGTQKIFDICIQYEENKRAGKIIEFNFRSKSRKAEHSFTYVLLKDGKTIQISGYSFEFSYYNAFLSYDIFQDACYSCKYARRNRIGDITLGDFWGIQKYDSSLKDYKGVSMISVNTSLGKKWFDSAAVECTVKIFPLKYAAINNQSYNHCAPFPKRKIELSNLLQNDGADALVRALECTNITKSIVYAKLPTWLIKLYHMLRGRT